MQEESLLSPLSSAQKSLSRVSLRSQIIDQSLATFSVVDLCSRIMIVQDIQQLAQMCNEQGKAQQSAQMGFL